MNRSVLAALFAASILLAACGGGGGGGVSTLPSGGGPSPAITPPATTTASGTVIDDPSGTPLAGVTVRLDPWIVYPTPGPTPTPIVTTTTDPSGHFSIAAANGHYLLVIGSDDANDATRPTIHDNITLSGVLQTLVAPTMPPVPGITPPPAETSGKYRLATIDQTHELPCITAYDQARAAANLPKPVIDEWLTENVRAWVQQSVTTYNGKTDPRNPYGGITSGSVTIGGGNSCADGMTFLSTGQTSTYFKASEWYAGSYYPYQQGSSYSAYGYMEFPIDPRLYTDPNVPIWI